MRSTHRTVYVRLARALAVLALAAAPAACAPAPALTPTSPAPAATEPAAAPQPPPPVERPAFEADDPAEDCFSGFREPTPCAGLDLVALEIVAADEAAGRRVFLRVTFAEDLAQAAEFGLCLYFDLDRDGATGLSMTDMPGLERLICATLPEGDAWTQHVADGGYDAAIERDPAQVEARLTGSTVVLAVDPALLGGSAQGFRLYVGSARSITQLDYFNGGGPLHVPLPLDVPADVLAASGAG